MLKKILEIIFREKAMVSNEQKLRLDEHNKRTYTGHIKTGNLICLSIAYVQCSKLEARIHSADKLHLPADLSSFIVNKSPLLLATNSNISNEESVKIEGYFPLCLGSSVFMPETSRL